MKKITTLVLVLLIGVTSLNARGLFHEESLDTDPAVLTGELVPTPQTEAVVQTIDVVGDSLGAVGIPFASYAGEVATGILGLATLLINVARSRQKKANITMVKVIEAKGGDSLKHAVAKRSNTDGTAKTIQSVVSAVT